MNRFILALAFIVIMAPLQSQEPDSALELTPKEIRKLEKQLQKEARLAKKAEVAAVVEAMVTQQKFVLEIDQLSFKDGTTESVSNTINFLAMDSMVCILQVGELSYIGENGVGGTTMKARIDDYKVKKHKNGNHTMSFNLRTSVGTYDVRMTANPNSRGEAILTSMTHGQQITYRGQLVPPGRANIYKGTTNY